MILRNTICYDLPLLYLENLAVLSTRVSKRASIIPGNEVVKVSKFSWSPPIDMPSKGPQRRYRETRQAVADPNAGSLSHVYA